MAGNGRGLLAVENIATTSTWVGIGSAIFGALPQEVISAWVSGANGKTMMVLGIVFTIVRLIDFPTLFGRK